MDRADLTELVDDTKKLLQAFMAVLKSTEGLPAGPDQRNIDAEGLAWKCFSHGSSCLTLSDGVRHPEIGFDYFDHASILVLARATIETVLVFDYVFVQPNTDPQREFRHLSWRLADMVMLQGFTANTPENREKQELEAQEIEIIRTRLKDNPVYKALSERNQKQLLEWGKWRWEKWVDIAIEVGLSTMFAENAYRFLCSYAHSGYLSVSQIHQAKTLEDQLQQTRGAMILVNVAVAYMVMRFCGMFPETRIHLDAQPELPELVQQWIDIGASVPTP